MMQLLRKDLPWLLVFGVGGAIALALAVAGQGFVDVFVLGPDRLEGLFWAAGSLGLALGVWSVSWDDLLGTREFLEQRGVSRRRLAAAPIVACLAVLALWAVVVPPLAWVLAAIFDGVFAPTHWAGVPQIEATLAVALPAAACGMLANSLPAGRLLRLLFLGGLVAVVGCGLDLVGDQLSSGSKLLQLPLADAAVAAVLFGLAVAATRRRHDPDRAWSPATRRLLGSLVLAVLTIGASGAVSAFEGEMIDGLHSTYPDFVVYDDQVRLARREGGSARQLCDEQHQAVDGSWVEGALSLGWSAPGSRLELEIEEPRFRTGGSRELLRDWRLLLLTGSGRAWIYHGRFQGLVETGIGNQLQPLPAGARLHRLEVPEAGNRVQQVLAADAVSGDVWRFDEAAGHFLPFPLPEGDRFQRFRISLLNDLMLRRPEALQALENTSHGRIEYVQGERGAYEVTVKGWQGMTVTIGSPERTSPLSHIGDDPLCYTVTVRETDEHPAASHEFAPHTATERLIAATIGATALARAPLLQLSSFVAPSDASLSPWHDPLLAGGRRWWLLLSCFGIGAGSAWQMRRFLRRWGADASTIRFWTVAAALTGIVGVVVGEFCERPRAHARRPVTQPAAPRIVSPLAELET